jgi:molybdenum cofactor biosynthesis enzyme MoaA
MKIQTLSIVAGSKACNAGCGFCVSRMTGLELDAKEPDVNWRNFHKACRLAQMNNVTTALITGKGEPTIFPGQITKFLLEMDDGEYDFPFIELQTNGLLIAKGNCDDHLQAWYDLGMTTIALSLVHWERDRNQEVYKFKGKNHYDLPALIKKLKDIGFSVRMTVMLLEGFVSCPGDIDNLIGFAKSNKVQQLTVRPLRKPEATHDDDVSQFVIKHGISRENEKRIGAYIDKKASLLMTLPHGAKIYDFYGQNICIADCLTINPEGNDVRQLIFFPDGSLRYDWQYPGAILI